jgi:hypothetical protein
MHAYNTGKSNKLDNTIDNVMAPLPHISSIQLLDTGEVDSLNQQEASSHLQELLKIRKQLFSPFESN